MSLQPLGAGAIIPTCVQLRSSKSGFPLSGAQPASSILPSELQIGEGSCLSAASGHPACRRVRQEMDPLLTQPQGRQPGRQPRPRSCKPASFVMLSDPGGRSLESPDPERQRSCHRKRDILTSIHEPPEEKKKKVKFCQNRLAH